MKLVFLMLLIACLSFGCSVAIKNMSTTPLKATDASKVVATTNVKSPVIKGVAVDSHGRALDTDGDGIPDYKDYELLTQLNCFPVDTFGIGLCPEPWCCRTHPWNYSANSKCDIKRVNVVFAPKSSILTGEAQQTLKTLGKKMQLKHHCRVRFGNGRSINKATLELRRQRINAITRFLVEEKGISRERLLLDLQLGGEDVVELEGMEVEDSPRVVPAPHPNLGNSHHHNNSSINKTQYKSATQRPPNSTTKA